MPVTFAIADQRPEDVRRSPYVDPKGDDPRRVVSRVWRSDTVDCEEVLQSSYQRNAFFVPNSNGFVNTVVTAYNEHHCLIIRPDDIWTSILSQMNLYINAHAEELRSKFVAHEGKKELELVTGGGRYTVDFGKLAGILGTMVKDNIVDPSLHDWIIPNYSTTTPNDVVVCSVMMMSSMKAYFSYKISLRCGIPSITLLGEKEDYISILRRTERLAEFGEEPRFFGRLLQPILTEICNAFDDVANGQVPDGNFWGKMCHYKAGGSGPSYLGGWVSAFSVWDVKGKWQGADIKDIEKPWQPTGSHSWHSPPGPLVFAGLRYPVIDTGDIADGFCEVDIKLDDNGELFDCMMIAGHVGYRISAQGGQFNTVQPSSEWFMFIKGEKDPEEKNKRMVY